MREHTWRGGWSIRTTSGVVLALVFDKGAAYALEKLLNMPDSKSLMMYGVPHIGEWPEL